MKRPCLDRQMPIVGAIVMVLLSVGGPLVAQDNTADGPNRSSALRGMLIEAERFTSRRPNDDSFAKVSPDSAASGGRVLTRFFLKGGRCDYEFEISERGRYDVSLRYSASRKQRIRFELDRLQRDQPLLAELPSTGKLAGYGAWNWVKLGTFEFAKGRHRLTLHGSAIRVDCIWISRGVAPPTAQQTLEARMGVLREQLKHPIEPVTPDWVEASGDYRLPKWFDGIRVSAHTRLSLPWRKRAPDVFAEAGHRFASLGFKEFARHIKSGDEPAWWPSRVGAVLPAARETNFAEKIIDEAHAAGCRLIVYHRHMEDAQVAKEHPEWTARDYRGNVIRKRGPKICFNTPYAEFVETRLIELARMGADGFYFDEVHMPKPFCWCQNCRAGFKRETGFDYPDSPDPFDPAYQKAIEFKNVTIERVFRRWRRAIHEVNSEAVLLIGSNTYPQLVERHTTHRLYRIADSMKTEFSLPDRGLANRVLQSNDDLAPTERDARLALGYTLSRDACDGRPPHVWIHGLPNALHARFATAGVIAHGGIANLDHPEATIPDASLFREAVSLGNRIAPAFAGMRPWRWAAIHYSESARDYYLPDESAAWRNVLYPVYGAYTTLLRAHLPVGVITDSQLEQGHLAGVKVLFVAARDHLTERMQSAVTRFEQSGGRVVYQRSEWRWHDPQRGMERAGRALLQEIAAESESCRVVVRGGSEKMHSVVYSSDDGSLLTVALVNDFSWVFTGRRKTKDGRPIPGIEARINRPAPPPCRNVRLVLRTARPILEIREMATGRLLNATATAGGYAVEIPEFECAAVLRVRLE